jgi:lipopolysaccharide export system protein LptA
MLLGALAILLVAIVAGFYVYARLRVRNAMQRIPEKLGVNIQQSTEGFSLSKSEGGHTLFTVKASKAVQYKQGGRAELRDVNIVIYGRQSNRFDQIYGADFEYDPKTGNISANGEVHIDLESSVGSGEHPDQSPPEELKNQIHLQTSGLVFNQKTGVASTPERIEFRLPQASGSAVGVEYDSKAATLTLGKDIQIATSDDNPAQIAARHGVITKGPNRAVLDGVSLQRGAGRFDADQVTVYLRDDNTVQHVVAAGNVRARDDGASKAVAQAARGDVYISPKNVVQTAVLGGGVEFSANTGNTASAGEVRGQSGQFTLSFGARSRLVKAVASDGVTLQQHPAGGGDEVRIQSDAVDFGVTGGKRLERATTLGKAQVEVVSHAASSANMRTVATAEHFDATFDRNNRLSRVIGMPKAKVVSSAPGQPDKTSTSDRMETSFNPTGGVAALLQTGNFHYQEPAAGASMAREAWAQQARYSPATSQLQLSGSPRVVEGGMTATAESMTLDRRTGQAQASGQVKTTYSEMKPQPGGALLATSDPVHVTAASMQLQQAGGMAAFTGGARLWQGANIVEAPEIDFDRNQRTIVATGPQRGTRQVTTVFTETDRSGKTTPLSVVAAKLTYSDGQRQAHFSGGVTVRGADATIAAEQMDVVLQPRGQSQNGQSGAPATPSQVERVVASGNVVVQQAKRRATGQQLSYIVADAKFTLTGGTPSIFDAERGKITGDSLTFYTRDDRVLVQGKSSPTVTQTRVAK